MTEEDRLLLIELKANMRRLFDEFAKLETEKYSLEEDIEKLKIEIQKLEQEKLNLSRDNKQIKIATQLALRKDEDGEAKKKIDSLIREIDKCIALLNK